MPAPLSGLQMDVLKTRGRGMETIDGNTRCAFDYRICIVFLRFKETKMRDKLLEVDQITEKVLAGGTWKRGKQGKPNFARDTQIGYAAGITWPRRVTPD